MHNVILTVALLGQVQLPGTIPDQEQGTAVSPDATWQGGTVWSAPTKSETKTIYQPEMILRPYQYQTHQWQQQYQVVPTGRYRCSKCGQFHGRSYVHKRPRILDLGPLGYFWWY